MKAARTIANQGVVLIATAHSTSLAHLVHNPTLSPLIGTQQTAQQLCLTHTTARGFRTWQLSEKHRLALERQAEEHHRDYGPIAARQGQYIEALMPSCQDAARHRYPIQDAALKLVIRRLHGATHCRNSPPRI